MCKYRVDIKGAGFSLSNNKKKDIDIAVNVVRALVFVLCWRYSYEEDLHQCD